ncbi:hypothetical protein ATL39_0060 [Sinobaca qinghaiensis]|uniref:Uncharacterized protein n=1 Tax=Sinobaca qinghaiensis TaxID=342944 RepID=A0A419VU75_9BACL|nr:hypothetical protein [Sinobaca qinghaiensis]RKD84127.1 hypothetical protein ATL39_0060 [Sinobaca qinghaiensis]
MGSQSLELWLGLGSIIGVLIGGICTIIGSYLASSKQVKAQKDIFSSEVSERYEHQRTELKLSLLADFMGHRNVIVGGAPGISESKKIAEGAVFFSALNKIGVIFSSSEEVINSYMHFRKIVLEKDIHKQAENIFKTGKGFEEIMESQSVADAALHDLAVKMHKDLDIEPPDMETFSKPLRM